MGVASGLQCVAAVAVPLHHQDRAKYLNKNLMALAKFSGTL